MNKRSLKYLSILFLLIIYINRGLFVSAPEAEPNSASTSTQGEVNSLIEFLHKLVSGYENGVDEDGNSPESYHFAKTVQPVIDQIQIQEIVLKQPSALMNNTHFPFTEIIFSSPTYGTIDHPPEKA